MDELIESGNDDPFDTRLRAEMAYIDDDGFTARVMQHLPKARTRRSFRALILLSVTVMASVLAYVISNRGQFVSDGIVHLAALPLRSVLLLALATGIAVTAFSLAAALAKVRESF